MQWESTEKHPLKQSSLPICIIQLRCSPPPTQPTCRVQKHSEVDYDTLYVHGLGCTGAPVESVAVNISVWRALQALSVDHYVIRHFTGFQLIQETLVRLRVTYCQVWELPKGAVLV